MEHVLRGDAEFSDSFGIGAQCDKVSRDVNLVLSSREEPVSGTRGVGDGLLGSECLTSNDEQSGLGIAQTERLGEVGTVNVRDKVGSEIALGVCLQSFGDHDGTQIGTTDTNVDDGVDRLAGISLPLSAPDALRELLDMSEDLVHFVHTRLGDLPFVKVSESDVKHGTIFGGVNVLSCEHLLAVLFDLGFAHEIEKSSEDGLGDEILGKVEEESGGGIIWGDIFPVELLEPLRILCEEISEDETVVLGIV